MIFDFAQRFSDFMPIRAGELVKPGDYLASASKKQEVEALETLWENSK